eukprot:TRINITY_DN38339_c0_g1_i2.p1 TRINITY_DN38339_c0_g1~~TRINITY_DN38339_c0_g1_i2.p1  ORF type:complete len:145 (-),score=42.90 TRINITY_DN38339_c0_g1_i2:103-537(-)
MYGQRAAVEEFTRDIVQIICERQCKSLERVRLDKLAIPCAKLAQCCPNWKTLQLFNGAGIMREDEDDFKFDTMPLENVYVDSTSGDGLKRFLERKNQVKGVFAAQGPELVPLSNPWLLELKCLIGVETAEYLGNVLRKSPALAS